MGFSICFDKIGFVETGAPPTSSLGNAIPPPVYLPVLTKQYKCQPKKGGMMKYIRHIKKRAW